MSKSVLKYGLFVYYLEVSTAHHQNEESASSKSLAAQLQTFYCKGVKPRTRLYASIVGTIAASLIPLSAGAATNAGVEDAVRQYFADSPVMIAVAKCESGFTMFSGDKALNGGSGGMIGIFQINAEVHARYAKRLGMDIYTLNGNLAYARYLYEREGTQPWYSSSECWEKEPAVVMPSMSTTSSTTMILVDTEAEIEHLRAIILALTQQLLELRKLRELASR